MFLMEMIEQMPPTLFLLVRIALVVLAMALEEPQRRAVESDQEPPTALAEKHEDRGP